MNAPRPYLLAALLAFAAVPSFAAFESNRIRSDNDMPRLPPDLLVEGNTRGHATVAISVDTEGKLDDLGVAHGGIVDAYYGSGLSFRDPDNNALEFFAPPG